MVDSSPALSLGLPSLEGWPSHDQDFLLYSYGSCCDPHCSVSNITGVNDSTGPHITFHSINKNNKSGRPIIHTKKEYKNDADIEYYVHSTEGIHMGGLLHCYCLRLNHMFVFVCCSFFDF